MVAAVEGEFDGSRPVDRRQRLAVAGMLLLAVVLPVGSAVLHAALTDAPEMVHLELAGSAASAGVALGRGCVGDAACVARYARALYVDGVLILAYSIALITVGVLADRHCAGTAGRRNGRLVVAATAVIALCDIIENVVLGRGLADPSNDTLWRVAAAVATLKFCVALPTVVIAVALLVTLLARCLSPSADYRWTHASDQVAPPVRPARRVGAAPTIGPDDTLPPGRTAGGLAVCLSGGGIRAACVALGALQVLRSDTPPTPRWRYLFSVSGGGYTAGALRIARDFSGDPVPGDLFARNSAEEAYMRRHGCYVADSPGQWAQALAVVFRNLLVSLGLLIAIACAVGSILGAFYAVVPLGLYPVDSPAAGLTDVSPTATGAVTAFGASAVLWVLSAIGHGGARALSGTPVLAWSRVTGALGVGTALVAALGLGIPAGVVLIRAGYVALSLGGSDAAVTPSDPLVAAGGAGTVLLTYLGAIGALAWRQRSRLGGIRSLFGGTGGVTAKVSSGWLLTIAVWVILALLVVAGAFLATITLSETARFVGGGPKGPSAWLIATWVLIALAALVSLLIDQTSLSLHPFYRRRLASLIAVRRRDDGTADELDYRERTRLSTHAADSGPQTVFCCAAELSGPSRTPPGARAAGFTMSHDWVGGPQVGWLSTTALERHTRKAFAGDATILGAVAISGAAIASAMGSQSASYEKLLTLSNARLGAWLPNPDWLARRLPEPAWWEPRLPRVRRITYLLRELLGRYSDDDRLLLVTDGGHYDNLGLVEALRHRPDTIIVIDASGDAPPMATTLAQAVTLARDELGVVVELRHMDRLVPGGAGVGDVPTSLSALADRLSADVAVEGTIHYPGAADEPGRLIVAKSRLTATMPYELLSYANGHAEFPYDSTADQWFDHEQFDAYRLLGEQLGRRAVALHRND